MFWDSSALLPYLVRERSSRDITALLERDGEIVLWWATPVECVSALERRRREVGLPAGAYADARQRLSRLCDASFVVHAHPGVRHRAERLLALHPLRAGDSLQLAAALVACDDRPGGESFACLDLRLREAAGKEGFTVLPAAVP